MRNVVLYFPRREELSFVFSETYFWMKKQGSTEKPLCAATLEALRPFAEEETLALLACDVTAEGVLTLLEQLRQGNPEMKLVLLADATVEPVKYIRPSILPSGLLWRPIQKEMAREVLDEVLSSLPKQDAAFGAAEEGEFSVEVRGVVRVYRYREILFFEAREKRLYLHLKRKELPFSGTLEKLMETLPEQFVRVHKSIIVNRAHIRQIQFGQNLLVMEDGVTVPVSRSYKAQLKAVFT